MAYREAQALTDEERQRWERDGYLVLELSSAESTIDGILNDLERLWDKQGVEDNVAYQRHRIRNAWKVSDNVRSVARDPKVLAVLEQLYGRTALPFQTLNFRYGTEQAVHSDAVHFGSDPPHLLAGVWAALEDIHEDSGPLVYYPGTHKLPEISMRDVGAEPDREQYDRYEGYVREFVERQGLEPYFATVKKGQALVWSANVLHGGSTRKDPGRTRKSQVTHYYFQGCRYFVPMTSRDDPAYYEPEWII